MKDKQVSLWDLFITFAKIGAFTIGGGYAMVLLIREEVVKKGWISEKEFPDILTLSQTSPGILAVNFSIFAGYRIRGTKGSVVATLGSCLPPFLVILAVAMFFVEFKDSPTILKIFKGIRPAVVAIIAVPMIKMSKETNKKWWMWAITAVVMLLVVFLKVSPVYIILITLICAVAATFYIEKKGGASE